MMRSELMTNRARVGAVAVAAVAAIVLAACGQKKDVAAGDAGGEVVAKVNGEDLTASQLTIALQKQRASDAASRQVLDQLVDEEIVAQKAVTAKLDKDPKVIAQIEAMRRDILARRFIESATDTAAKPGDDAIQKFYDSRPLLFAQRKLYTLQRLDIQAPEERRTDVDAHVQSLKTSAELTDWLKSQKLAFAVKQEQDASEQLPAAVLEKLAAMKDGESVVVPSQPGVVSALTLVSSASAPKSLADTRPAIEQFLAAQGRRELLMNLQKTIRDGAKVDYLGRFAAPAPAGGDAAASAPAPAVAPAASTAAPSASQNTPAQK